ncbi:MAG: Gfo/Idh/MocA family oxidoreductase [Clostridia bacterium]|nr:Gfo/Idh/MocA family oxidoreductase [Clostridia bacterium]
MLSYVIVGSGYRAEYFGRIAHTYPDLFRALFLCRSEEKATLMRLHTGVEATISLADCLAFQPDFVVIAIDRGHIAEESERWIERGYPVVTETPVGCTPEELRRLWQLSQQGAKIVCCEQYHRQPLLAAGLKAVREGKIGQPSSMYLSLVHDYHAASLIWLGLGIEPGEPYTLQGTAWQDKVVETDSRYGAIYTGQSAEITRTLAHISFQSGKEAVYDFSPIQYRTYLRSRHLTLRGTRGEWSDTFLSWLDERNEPQRLFLLPEIQEKYRALDTQALRDKRRNWLFELAPDTVQDEFAIASLLLDMKDYLAGGPSPYPLEHALEDAYFWIMLSEAVSHPGVPVNVDTRPWNLPSE